MSEVMVIGAGLFGSVIAKELRSRGMEVSVIDAGKQNSGSRPAACLIRSSWIAGLGKEILQPALKMLDKHYGVETIKFKTGTKYTDVQFVKPNSILKPPDKTRTISGVHLYKGGWQANDGMFGQGRVTKAKVVIIAAGIWTPALLPVIGGLSGQAGVSFLWPEEKIEVPFIHPYAPYKQIVAFNRGDGLWMGDGTAIKQENWTAGHTLRSSARCQNQHETYTSHQTIYGIRPYSKEKPCYLREHQPNLWVATGGAKNGLLAAAWCAEQISKRLCK